LDKGSNPKQKQQQTRKNTIMFNSEKLEKKWAPVLEAQDAPKFKDNYRKSITAVLLENQEKALSEERAHSSFITEGNAIGGGSADGANAPIQTWDPVLISLVRRAMPNIVAYDIAGVQPMTMPTGLIFAMKSQYQKGDPAANFVGGEALFNKPDTAFSGPVTTAQGEALSGDSTDDDGRTGPTTGTPDNVGFGQMGFTVEKTTVTAKTRALKAEYTMELAQDLKSVHGLDAEAELANILSVEILAEINREVIDTINAKAKLGGLNGAFDLDQDADGRWAVEKFKSLLFQIEVEANEVAKATRRGKGNFIVCSSNVASALAAAGVLDYAPALATNLNVDDTGNVFAGMINGRLKVFIDPFAAADYVTVGYRGTNAYDAGMFYCPYVPLTMVRAVDPATFQPKIGFKTRYGLVANPFAGGAGTGDGLGTARQNPYFRTFSVAGVNGAAYY
jgi:hypothetical protein